MARSDWRVLGSEQGRRRAGLDRFLAPLEAAKAREWDARVRGLSGPDDVQVWQERIRQGLSLMVGEFPERTPLRARTTGILSTRGITIENVVFESRPRYFVTANLYRPARASASAPAPTVLIPCGHCVDGKTAEWYRISGMTLAANGYVAMVFDPTGQGERSECIRRETGREFVPREVPQHHYTGKPTFLTGATLGGYRAWDGIRCLDYLCTRPEVDPHRIGMMGNSGGGAMTLMIACLDQRVAACAAGHPGGSMENSQLDGRRPPDRALYSLLAPRPCRLIVGLASNERGHLRTLRAMRPFYRACGHPERLDLVWVEGGHDLKLPKRLAAYAWLARWLDGPPIVEAPQPRPVSARRLLCTRTGQVQTSLGGETMQSLNARAAARLAPVRQAPASAREARGQCAALRRAVARRLAFVPPAGAAAAASVRWRERIPGGTVSGLTFASEPRATVPAWLLLPESAPADAPVIVHSSADGKPAEPRPDTLPLRLMRLGFPVLTFDARDTGETSVGPILNDRVWPRGSRNPRAFNERRWAHDALALRALSVGRTLLGMRALDVIRAADAVRTLPALAGRRVMALGEGDAGAWVLAAAALGAAVDGVATVRTLLSYRMLTDNALYNRFDHFWTPGVLCDFDLPDLPALAAPRLVLLLDPVDEMSRRLAPRQAARSLVFSRRVFRTLGAPSALNVHRSAGTPAAVARCLADDWL